MELKLNTVEEPVGDLIINLVNDLQTFSAHLFRSKWQQDQCKQVKVNNLDPESCVLVIDFVIELYMFSTR